MITFTSRLLSSLSILAISTMMMMMMMFFSFDSSSLTSFGGGGVDAKLCKESRSSSIWKHDKGSFKKVGPTTWKEFNDKNIPSPDEFEQVLVEGTAVVIHDKKRDVQILLKDDVAGIKNSEAIRRNDPNFNQLYAGSFIKLHAGTGALPVDGQYVVPMSPSNHMFHDPVALRQQLDQDGYIYLKNLVPRDAVRAAYVDICRQIEKNNWWSKETEEELVKRDGFMFGAASPPPGTTLPAPIEPFHITEKISKACYGPSVVAAVRHLFGGGAECMNYNTLELNESGAKAGFHMPAVYMNQGTKLVLTCWVALHDMPFNVGGIVCAKGSNSQDAFMRVRETYGAHEVETGDISGDGCLTWDPVDVWNLGDGVCPLATASFEPGDVVLSTVYTMQGMTTNLSKQWRISAVSRWVMHGDDVGCDPRFKTGDENAVQLSRWMASRNDTQRYPRTMMEARKAWGIPPVNVQ